VLETGVVMMRDEGLESNGAGFLSAILVLPVCDLGLGLSFNDGIAGSERVGTSSRSGSIGGKAAQALSSHEGNLLFAELR